MARESVQGILAAVLDIGVNGAGALPGLFLAGELPAQGSGFQAGQQFKRCFEQANEVTTS